MDDPLRMVSEMTQTDCGSTSPKFLYMAPWHHGEKCNQMISENLGSTSSSFPIFEWLQPCDSLVTSLVFILQIFIVRTLTNRKLVFHLRNELAVVVRYRNGVYIVITISSAQKFFHIIYGPYIFHLYLSLQVDLFSLGGYFALF